MGLCNAQWINYRIEIRSNRAERYIIYKKVSFIKTLIQGPRAISMEGYGRNRIFIWRWQTVSRTDMRYGIAIQSHSQKSHFCSLRLPMQTSIWFRMATKLNQDVWRGQISFQTTSFTMTNNISSMKCALKLVPGLADVGVPHGDGDGPRAPLRCLRGLEKISNDQFYYT